MIPNPPSATVRPVAEHPLRHFVIAFLIALALYATVYAWIQNRRTRKGPWEIAFTNNAGVQAIVINQPQLRLTNVTLLFPGGAINPTTNQGRADFRDPRPTPFDVGFGRCVFEDLTFLPGTVTLQAYNHEIELLPRVLVIDQKERSWKSGDLIALEPR